VSADIQIEAMGKVAAALDPLDETAVNRVIRWAADRYAIRDAAISASEQSLSGTSPEASVPSDIHELFGQAGPLHSDQERVLLAALWFQEYGGVDSFTSQQVNNELKQMGFGVANITAALTRLMGQRPALAQQVSKSGRAQQARKRYRLTRAGMDAARRLCTDERLD
jgi:hypothetical protein